MEEGIEESKGHLLRVFVVEDEPDTANLIKLTLCDEGFDVQSASCVEEAQEYLKSTAPLAVDLVITDWLLPDGTGAQVCAAMRAINPAVPIIVFSGAYEERDLAIAECKATFYLAKPILMPHLLAIVKQLLKRASQKADDKP